MFIAPDLDVLKARVQLSYLNNAKVTDLTVDEAMGLIELFESEREANHHMERDLEVLEYDLERARDELHSLKDENVELAEKAEELRVAVSNVIDKMSKGSK